MPATNSPPTTGLARLQKQLAQLEQFGLQRPANASLSEYLRFLVDEKLVDEQTARLAESLYHRSRFGNSEAETSDLGRILHALDAAFTQLEQSDAGHRSRLAGRLRQRFGSSESGADATLLPHGKPLSAGSSVATALPPAGTADAPEDRAAESDESTFGTGTTRARPVNEPVRAERPKWLLIAGILAVWTAATLVAGYLVHDRIDGAVASLLGRSEPEPDGTKVFIEQAREDLLKIPPESRPPQVLYRLARLHSRRKEYAESIAGFHQLLAHQTDDEVKANVLNELAWELLTAEDEWYRDPVYAKELAEQAVAVKPDSPMILDTLAEAFYQTGDATRAVELERQAIAKLEAAIGPESQGRAATLQFMRSQLRKFSGKSRIEE